jgi:hypothetical protein
MSKGDLSTSGSLEDWENENKLAKNKQAKTKIFRIHKV